MGKKTPDLCNRVFSPIIAVLLILSAVGSPLSLQSEPTKWLQGPGSYVLPEINSDAWSTALISDPKGSTHARTVRFVASRARHTRARRWQREVEQNPVCGEQAAAHLKLKDRIDLSDTEIVTGFYSLLSDEVVDAGYSARELSLLNDRRLYYGRYLDEGLRNYFVQTVVPRIAGAVSYLDLRQRPNLRIMDLGCGLGMQSLLFASLGATVVGVDIREESIALCNKRKAYYEERLGRSLDVSFRCVDFRRTQQSEFDDKFDCLFSMSAFSYMQPVQNTVRTASNLMNDRAKLYLYEENSTHVIRKTRRRTAIPSPRTTISEFNKECFRVDFLEGASSLPSMVWRADQLNRILQPANDHLRRNLALSTKYVLGMSRSDARPC